jgi:hypothetical protein
MPSNTRSLIINSLLIILLLLFSPIPVSADLVLGPVEFVQANGVDIQVPGYSVPSFVPWDGDDLPDLVLGEGGLTSYPGKVRIYLNVGTFDEPSFGDYSFVQSNGVDLEIQGGG